MKKTKSNTKNSSETKTLSPLRMGLNLKKNYPFVLIHPDNHGFGYKVFWGENYDLEIVATSSKIHKTKKECIREVKKLQDFWSSSFGSLRPAFDHRGERIDIKIKYDVKKLL